MKIITMCLLTFLLTSCAILEKRQNQQPQPFKTKPQKFEDCVERFFRLGMDANEVLEICKEVHK